MTRNVSRFPFWLVEGCRAVLGARVGRASIGLLLLAVLALPDPADAQQRDTTDTRQRVPPSDTAQTPPPDTLDQPRRGRRPNTDRAQPSFTPAPFGRLPYGTPAVDSLPARISVTGVTQILEEQPGTFLYALGAVAWPHGWSADGLAPHRSRLWLTDLPYSDPLTGRPRFDLLPSPFLQRPRIGLDPAGTPTGVHVDWRDYDQKRPITEIRFRRDSNGLQNAEVSHSQQRRLSLLGWDGLLQATVGFKGRATAGAYGGSSLRKERGVWGRLRYRTRTWIVELADYSNRFRLGVHGGIEPVGDQLGTIYLLPSAVNNARFRNARQNTIRNDLVARVRGPLTPLPQPAQVSVGWTANTYDYQTDYDGAEVDGETLAYSDTLWSVRTNSLHGAFTQPLRVGRHHLSVSARGTVQQRARGTALVDAESSLWNVHALVRDSIVLGPASLVLDGGLHQTDAQSSPTARAELRAPLGPLTLRLQGSLDGQPIPWVLRSGFAGFVDPLQADPSGQVRRVEGELRAEAGVWDARLTGFAHQVTDPVDLYAGRIGEQSLGVDTVAVRQASSPFARAGVTLAAGVRREARRGLYATGHVTGLTFLNASDSPLHRRVAETLPEVYGRGRIGARFVFFEDLITDLSVQVRGWTDMNSRLFHPPTGLMVVPSLNEPVRGFPGRRVGPSYTVDVRAEATLMGAKLFFTFENVQSAQILPQGSRPQLGTFVTPLYPLPPLQFRFGVHWPIFD